MENPMIERSLNRQYASEAPPAAGLGACIHSDLAQQMALLSQAIDDLQASLGPILRCEIPKPAGQTQATAVDCSALHDAAADLATQAAQLVEQVMDIERRLDL